MSGMHTTDLGSSNIRERAFDFVRKGYATAYAVRHGINETDVYSTPGFERLKAKAVVGAGSTVNLPPFADPSARAYRDVYLVDDLIHRSQGLIEVPIGVPIPSPELDAMFAWTGQGMPTPTGTMTATSVQTEVTKIGGNQVFSNELFRTIHDSNIRLMNQVTTKAFTAATDAAWLSADAEVSGLRPAGLLAGLSPLGSGSPSNLEDDLQDLFAAVRGGEATFPTLVTSRQGALYLASQHNNGTPLFPGVSVMNGGTIFGVPLLLSRAAGTKLILYDAGSIAVSDLGAEITRSDHAAIEMVDTPVNSAATGTPANLVSAFQVGATILRLVRWLNWKTLTDDSVAYLELPISLGSPS